MFIVAGHISQHNQTLDNKTLIEISRLYPLYNTFLVSHNNLKAVVLSSEHYPHSNDYIYEDEHHILFVVGNIYNKKQIAADAGLNVNDITTDQQIFIQAYLKLGESFIEHCYGKWFFIRLYKPTFEITLYRDHFGMMPFYYYRANDAFTFSSSLKILLQFREVSRQLNKRQLGALFLGFPGKYDETSYEHIKKVPSASKVVLKANSKEKIIAYWQPTYAKKHYNNNEDIYTDFNELLNQILDETISRSDNIATTLSSGLDSSFLTAFTARKLSEQNRTLFAATSVPLDEYKELDSVRRYGNELPLSQLLVARYSNLIHVIDNAKEVSLIGALRQSLHIHGYPVRNAMNQYWVLSMLQQLQLLHVQKLLIAQMGNLTISWPFVELRQSLFRKLLQIGAMKLGVDTKQLITSHKKIFNEQFLRRYKLADFFKQVYYHPSFQSISLNKKRNYFLKFYLLQGYATWNEKGSHYNLDIIDPLADPRIIDFCFSLPSQFFVNNNESRLFVKRLGKHLLPPEIINNPKKAIQSADIHVRIQKEYNQIEEILQRSLKNDLLNEIFNTAHMFDLFRSGQIKNQVFLRYLLIILFLENETAR